MKPKRYEDGGDVREGRNENISDDTRARAMEAVRRRLAGEAEPVEPVAPRAVRPVSRPVARPMTTPAPAAMSASRRDELLAQIPADLPEDKSYRSGKPVSWGVDQEIMRALPGVAGVGLPAAARGVGRVAGALASAAGKGFQAGRAERAAERSEARYPRQQREAERMEAEGPVRTTPVARSKSVNRSGRERTPEEARYADEGNPNFKRGGKVKKYASGGMVGASRRADGIAKRGKTKGRIV